MCISTDAGLVIQVILELAKEVILAFFGFKIGIICTNVQILTNKKELGKQNNFSFGDLRSCFVVDLGNLNC